MIKILYILGTGSKHDNAELRWSLRSLERFCLPQCEVEPIVIGDVPDWFLGKSLSCCDSVNRKEKNIYSKIIAAVNAGLVDGEFQISADDHFWCADYDLSKLPVFWRETCLPAFKGDGNNYAKAMAGTRNILFNHGFPAINTTVHCNQWVNVDDLAVVDDLWKHSEEDEFAREFGLVNWAVFPNVSIASGRHNRRPVKFRHDLKFGFVSTDEFKDRTKDAVVFSINDDAFDSVPVMNYMTENFSTPSRWEKC